MDEEEIAHKAKQQAGMPICIDSILTIEALTTARCQSTQGSGREGQRQRSNEYWRTGHQEEWKKVNSTKKGSGLHRSKELGGVASVQSHDCCLGVSRIVLRIHIIAERTRTSFRIRPISPARQKLSAVLHLSSSPA